MSHLSRMTKHNVVLFFVFFLEKQPTKLLILWERWCKIERQQVVRLKKNKVEKEDFCFWYQNSKFKKKEKKEKNFVCIYSPLFYLSLCAPFYDGERERAARTIYYLFIYLFYNHNCSFFLSLSLCVVVVIIDRWRWVFTDQQTTKIKKNHFILKQKYFLLLSRASLLLNLCVRLYIPIILCTRSSSTMTTATTVSR